MPAMTSAAVESRPNPEPILRWAVTVFSWLKTKPFVIGRRSAERVVRYRGLAGHMARRGSIHRFPGFHVPYPGENAAFEVADALVPGGAGCGQDGGGSCSGLAVEDNFGILGQFLPRLAGKDAALRDQLRPLNADDFVFSLLPHVHQVEVLEAGLAGGQHGGELGRRHGVLGTGIRRWSDPAEGVVIGEFGDSCCRRVPSFVDLAPGAA